MDYANALSDPEEAHDLLETYYPGVTILPGDDAMYALEQMIVARNGHAVPEYQSQWNNIVQPALLSRLSEIIYLDNDNDFQTLMLFVQSSPEYLRSVWEGDLDDSITNEAIRMNNAAQGDWATNETMLDIRFPERSQRWG